MSYADIYTIYQLKLYLDLLIGRHSTEDDLREALCWKHTEAHSADNSVFLDEAERLVFSARNNTSPAPLNSTPTTN